MEDRRRINESVKKKSNPGMTISSIPKKRPMITIVERDKGGKGSNLEKVPCSKKKTRRFPVLPPFLVEQNTSSYVRELDQGRSYSFVRSRVSSYCHR